MFSESGSNEIEQERCQSKTFIVLSTNVDQNALETVFSILDMPFQ